MKIKKTVLMSILLMFGVLMLAYSEMFVSAKGFDGDLTYEEGAVDYISPEMKELEAKKLLELQKMRVRYPSQLSLSMKWFKQDNGYYCGPAAVKQAVEWINKSSETQSWYAEQLGTTTSGTDMTKIPGVLNDCINEKYYVYSSIGSTSEWMEKIRSGIYYDRPAIIDINTKSSGEFPYDTDGHFVTISGYSDIDDKVQITDPNDESGSVWYDIDVLYGVNNAHFRKAIVW